MLAGSLLAFAGAAWIVVNSMEDISTLPPAEVAEELAERAGAHRRLGLALLLGLPPALAIAIAGSTAIARRGLAPLERVVRLATELDPQRLDERVEEVPGSSLEALNLTRAINGMLDRIEASVSGMRRFTADASHELRTPLAVVMNDLEVALRRERSAEEMRENARRALEELSRMARLVESLLVLARSDSGQLQLEQVPLDLSQLAQRLGSSLAPVARGRNLALSVEADCGPVPVIGYPLWLERSAANLLDNALKFTPQGGKVVLSVARGGGRASLSVDDSGPGVAPEERERVFDRFFRGSQVKGRTEGVGIGLAISREMARRQGGEVRLSLSPLGGARFVLELPEAAGAPQ